MKVFLTLLLIGLVRTAIGQTPAQVLQRVNTVTCDNTNFYQEIPFEYRNNHIVIQVSIGRQVYDYIFDTGGYNNATDAIQQKNQFPVLTTQTVGGANQLKAKIDILRADTLRIGNLVFTDVALLQMDYRNVPTIACSIDGGLVGASIIKKFIWQIDYPNRKLIVTDQKQKVTRGEQAVRIPVSFNSRLMPFIELMVDGRWQKVMFDTGSSTLLSMPRKTAKQYGQARHSVKIVGAGVEGGNGILAQQDIGVFKAGVVQLGSLTWLNKPVVYHRAIPENLLGNPVIKNYLVTLNFPENELYLEPIQESPVEEGWRSLGFTLGYDAGKIKVVTLHKGLQADRQGLRLGDEISAINGQPITCQDFCACFSALPDLLTKSQEVTLRVAKGGQARNLNFHKEKIY